ncbi:MAG: thioesterase [Flavobacteriales bacterium]|nr:thioesterase [Flavobacteriales bacterium]MAC95504.1 thioesterase [Flavobacteriales bacterium]|tara:strand:- start:81 stop:485 length:405 start_codon:yes stop_codon:yes gene_type:complete
MIQEKITLNVRYAETDQMGFVYYGNYAQYLELGRVAAMKKVGISYRALEEEGIGLPVKSMNINYLKAARYDDEIKVVTTIQSMPTNRITFEYQIYREKELLIEAETTLFFMSLESGRPIRPPKFFIDQMKAFFS